MWKAQIMLSKLPQLKFSQYGENFVILVFRHAYACLTLLYNIVEENLRAMKERKKERMTKSRAFYY